MKIEGRSAAEEAKLRELAQKLVDGEYEQPSHFMIDKSLAELHAILEGGSMET